MPQPTPPIITQPFGLNAAAPFIQNPIPVSTVETDRASFNLGFPPRTMQEVVAGGVPPYGQDMNGILYMITAHIAAAQAGQPYLYSSTVSTAMGGYALGTVLGMADGTGLWISSVAANTTDPDAGGAGWLPLYNHGFADITGLTGGVRTLTAAEYRRPVIVLSGALAGNLQVVFPNATAGQRAWLIVNNCTGGFSVTVKTLTGSGVSIPAGGFNGPTEVYVASPDGGVNFSIYPTVAPITLPTDVNPTANTIALRNNSGYLFATYFNQNSPLENFTISGIYADAGDGFHRKITRANLAAQISLSQFAGTVSNAQVPQSAVTQHAAALWSNAALSGNSTAPTFALGTSDARIATTQFANPDYLKQPNGHVQFPSGVILQWGTINYFGSGSDFMFGSFSFARSFPLGCFSLTGNGTTKDNGQPLNVAGKIPIVAFDSINANGARWRIDTNGGVPFTGAGAIKYMAVGY
jgi:hypothetical protein